MDAVFLKILNMSITAAWLILAVVLARLFLKKAPKWITCLMWALVAVRLICPFSIESALSMIPSAETIPSGIEMEARPAIDSGIQVVNEVVNPMIYDSFAPDPVSSANPLQIWIPVASLVWIGGVAIMLIYALVSYLKLKRTVAASVPFETASDRAGSRRIRLCDEIPAPFILGVFRPVIYVPSSMKGETLRYVLRHEEAHLKRFDHLWKPLGFLLLSIYWFNPLCWVAYVLLCRDIEMACDEKVIRNMESSEKADYSQALLDCSFPRKRIAACPVAFGEVGVKERVKGVLNYKKPAFWLIIGAIALCAVIAVCLMTNPLSNRSLSGKLAASMDMAVANQNRSSQTQGEFAAVSYDVMHIKRTAKTTTVYAWVMYEEFSYDGQNVHLESGSYIPSVITFDTSSRSDTSTYNVIEYWIPRDGTYFVEDIHDKFPMLLWRKAVDVSGSERLHEECLKAAQEYFAEYGRSGAGSGENGGKEGTGGTGNGDRTGEGGNDSVFPNPDGVDFSGSTLTQVTIMPTDFPAYSITFLLPEGWSYEVTHITDDPTEVTVNIWPEGRKEEGVLTISYWKSFGVCGTGLEEKTILFNGHEAWQGFYTGEPYWNFIALKDPRGCVVLNQAHAWYGEYETEIEQILATVEFEYCEEAGTSP